MENMVNENSSARAFYQEMELSGIGNLGYKYFQSLSDPETVLLIDSWKDRASLDAHHASPMMTKIATLRRKYDLHMKVERVVSEDVINVDKSFVRPTLMIPDIPLFPV